MKKLGIPKSTPKDVFSHLLAIVTLFISMISFITLIFQYIGRLIPDPTKYINLASTSGISAAMAALLVAWPVYILIMWQLSKDIKNQATKKEIKIRKWLFYFTLFIAAIVIIVDLITIFVGFFEGDLTSQFILKAVTVLLVAGAVFSYYLWDLGRDFKATSSFAKAIVIVSSMVFLSSIIAGFFIIGSPAERRLKRLDQDRVSALNTIESRIVEYWRKNKELPATISDAMIYGGKFEDPETGEVYEYATTGELRYELCATFSSEASNDDYRFYRYADESPWGHPSGRHCFEREINTELIKPVAID